MTSRPGTLEYMPPEAFGASAAYDSSLDVFSFGHLALFVAIQESPTSLLPYCDRDGLLLELERRYKYIARASELLGKSHVIVTLITQCLQNHPQDRPTAAEILKELTGMYMHNNNICSTKAMVIRLLVSQTHPHHHFPSSALFLVGGSKVKHYVTDTWPKTTS